MILTKLMRPRDKFVCSLVGENVGLKQFIEYEAYEYSSMSQPFSVNEQNSEKLDMKIRHTHLLPVRTLNDIAAKHLDTSIPWFLSIDVEGADFEVLKSYDFEFSKPYLICIEDHNYQRNQFSLQNNYIMNLGYKLVEKTDLSLIYILDVN